MGTWVRERTAVEAESPRLSYLATAHQLGVIGYRDPPGAIAVDGQRIAYGEGRRLYETLASGGARVEIAAGEGQIRHVAPFGAGEWIFEDGGAAERWWRVSSRSASEPLFGVERELKGVAADGGSNASVRVNNLRQIVASPDGTWLAATANGPSGPELWRITVDGWHAEVKRLTQPVTWPAWMATGELACTLHDHGRWRLSIPCGAATTTMTPDVEVWGPLAFSPIARTVYFGSPNANGMLDLWSASLDSRHARRLTNFARDTYAPSAAFDGRAMFKVQSYRTSVTELDLVSGQFQQLSTLQAETPSYHPDGRRIAVTYGTWRRVIDDAKYPDIAQDIGTLASFPADGPRSAPIEVIAASDSEDQAMSWSPNGRWIALHSHREQSDDIWLRPADGSASDRRISFLGRGAEVGWPRWSPDGRWVLYDGASPSTRRSVLFVVGVDQNSGAITAQPREIAATGVTGEITHGEWLPDSATIVAIAKEGAGRHAVVTLPAADGQARVIYSFATEHDFPGLAASPDGRFIALIAPAPDGYFQIFRLPTTGGTPEQVTFDRSHKTQPAWSPDGRRLAFTVWSYDVQFWLLK